MSIHFSSTKLPHSSNTSLHDGFSAHTKSSEISTLSSVQSSIAKPLGWREARIRMRQVLNAYMKSPPLEYDVVMKPNENQLTMVNKLLHFWFSHDLDCYLGSIMSTLLLLILSLTFYVKERLRDGVSAQSLSTMSLFASHITASSLLLAGSVLSVWLLHRRRITSSRGAETKKRNIVASFLSVLDEMIDNAANEMSVPSSTENVDDHPPKIPGTSLTDIYPVYRISEDENCGKWHKLPCLLLVEGDFIGLQLGDSAPADCKLVTGSKIGLAHASSTSLKMMSTPNLKSIGNSQHHSLKAQREPMIVKAGDKVEPSLRMKSENRSNAQVYDHLFLPGKSKVDENSRKLLHLSNHSKIFQVLESPVVPFLRKQVGVKKVPQIHRKGREIRIALYFFSMITIFLSYIVIYIRHSVEEVHFPIVLNLPLLAALGTLPIAAPAIFIMLEVIGTSRILVTVHPYSLNIKHIGNTGHLFLKYLVRGIESRLQITNSCTRKVLDSTLMDFPIALSFLYEKLGVVTAFSLIDDELACDPVSTPQQLLIPTSNGLKLLDLFPKYDVDSDDESDDENHVSIRRRAGSMASSHDSDSDWGDEPPIEDRSGINNRMQALIKFRRKYKKRNLSTRRFEPPKPTEVQFEDPNWWKYLPSLKCIGLASLLVDNKNCSQAKDKKGDIQSSGYIPGMAENSLITHVKQYYDRTHLRLLSECIGFVTKPNAYGSKGDVTPFEELRRIRIIATRLMHHRMNLDRHQISLEESRSWGSLRPDSTSVIVKDHRSQAYQLLTVGDARVVIDVCSSAWQGESITPLSFKDRKTILESNNEWNLADLDVTAFSYAPIPYSSGEKFAVQYPEREHHKSVVRPMTHLIDNRSSGDVPATLQKDSSADDWSLIKNQMFLGLLGSCVSPRKDVASLIEDCTHAGVRFVYFSPRNMRRTKELASQMGIDVAWNCAISLRSLDEGEERDEHRMTSEYADWSVKARLPHGVEDVKRHLEAVDNVPLLVSLFTDATKESTCEMMHVFQNYHDTVLSLGLSHLSQNDDTFSASDLSFGNDVLFDDIIKNHAMTSEETPETIEARTPCEPSVKELLFVSKIASHSCVFNLSLGQSGLLNIAEIIEKGRAALTSGTAAGMFVLHAGFCLTLSIFFCILSASTAIPVVSASGIVLYIQIFIPVVALSMAFSTDNEAAMTIVPPKNDQSITFAIGERRRLCFHLILRALLPVISSHLVQMIGFGSLVLEFDPDIFEVLCDLDATSSKWTDVIRCADLKNYIGYSSLAASSLMIAELSLCVIAQSTSFLFGNNSILESNPIRKNRTWLVCSISCLAIICIKLHLILEDNSLRALPWYLYLIAFVSPFVSVMVCELVKKRDKRYEERAEKLRRLQFETRLGMWSPK